MKSKTRQIARSIFSGHKYQVETPRVQMTCQLCDQPAEKLHVGLAGLFVCDSCYRATGKKGTK